MKQLYNQIRKNYLNNRPTHQVWGSKGGVTTMDPIATKVGNDILNNGGNAIDAAVAISTTLAVTSPNWSGLAGDSAWLYFDNNKKKSFHLDGYSVCPNKISISKLKSIYKLKGDKKKFDYEEPKNLRNTGISCSMIPGTPFLIDKAHMMWGSTSFKKLIKPSINLAKNGFPVSEYLFNAFFNYRKKITQFKSTKKIIDQNETLKPGSTFIQKDLANTLTNFSKLRSKEFTSGNTFKLIMKYNKLNKGFFSEKDFKKYQIKIRKTFSIKYGKYIVETCGMPTSGINLLQCFELLKRHNLNKKKLLSNEYMRILINTLQLVLINRRETNTDPDFTSLDQKNLLRKNYLKNLKLNFKLEKKSENNSTTHFCVWDSKGNVVSATQSIGYQFGCGEIVDKTGLFMNDRTWWMSFSNTANKIEPNKRCNIGHAPTIVYEKNKPIITIGSPGGFGIIQYIFQVLVHVFNYGIDLQTAIDLPRFRVGNNFKDVYIENRFKKNLYKYLKSKNINPILCDEWTDLFGGVEGIFKNKSNNYLNCYDIRRNSHSLGLD